MKSLAERRAERRRDAAINSAEGINYGPDEHNARVNEHAGTTENDTGADTDDAGEGSGADDGKGPVTLADAGIPAGAAAGNGGLAEGQAATAASETKAPGAKPGKAAEWKPGA